MALRSTGSAPTLTLIAALPLASACSDDDAPIETPKPDSGVTVEAGAPDASDAGDAGPAPKNEWPMLGQSPRSTFFNEAEKTISKDTVSDLEVAWTADLGTNITGAPIQADGKVFAVGVGTYCFDAESGDELWHNEDVAGPATPAYSDGVVYLNDRVGVLHALDASNGKQKWEVRTGDQEGMAGYSSPVVAGDLVLVGGSTDQELTASPPTIRGHLFAADKKTGEKAWDRYTVPEGSTGASFWSTVSVSLEENRVYGGTGNNYTEPATDTSDSIISFHLDTGEIDWKAQRYEGDIWSVYSQDLGNPDYDFGTNPILFEAEIDGKMTALVAAGQKSGDMHVLRRKDGEVIATRNLSPGGAAGENGIFNNGAWDGERLLFAGNGATSDAPGSEAQDGYGSSVLFAIDPATGDIVWERQLPGVVMAPITVANGVGFVPADSHLEAFDTKTGELLFKYTMPAVGEEPPAMIASAPTIAEGRVAFGSGIGWFFGAPGSILTVLHIPD